MFDSDGFRGDNVDGYDGGAGCQHELAIMMVVDDTNGGGANVDNYYCDDNESIFVFIYLYNRKGNSAYM